MVKLNELQIEEIEEDLEDLNDMIEACPDSDLITLKDLCNKRDRLLAKLWKLHNPFVKGKSWYLYSD